MAGFRKKAVALSAVCLLSGLAIYVFLRTDTYFHAMLPDAARDFFGGISNSVPSNLFTGFLRYYFVDFLWGASLTFALCAVSHEIKRKNIIISALVSLAVGILFEFAQLFSLVSGTFDFADIAMYVAASALCAAICLKFFRVR